MKLTMAQVLAAITDPDIGRGRSPKTRRRAGELDDEDRKLVPASSEQLCDGFTVQERQAAREYLERRRLTQRYDPMWETDGSWMQ